MPPPIRNPLVAPGFAARIADYEPGGLRRSAPRTLQVNVGRRCDLACHHCHVEAGPNRSEVMGERVVHRILWLLERSPELETLDLTGGAPELCPDFRTLVRGARALDRCARLRARRREQEAGHVQLEPHRLDAGGGRAREAHT